MKYLAMASVLIAAGGLWIAWLQRPAVPETAGAVAATSVTAPAGGSGAARSSGPATREAGKPSPEAPDAQDSLPPGLDAAEAERRRRLLELRQAADRRFNDTITMDGLTSDQVRPEVRRLFETVGLEPVFDLSRAVDGLVNGLRITELRSNSPLAQAGFHNGDLLTRLDGQPLQDPAQIAYTLTSLDAEFEVCAERNEGHYCRLVSAGGSGP